MIIKVHSLLGVPLYILIHHIIKFSTGNNGSDLILTSGAYSVKETPEEIVQLIKANQINPIF